jgi:hypothetical protein
VRVSVPQVVEVGNPEAAHRWAIPPCRWNSGCIPWTDVPGGTKLPAKLTLQVIGAPNTERLLEGTDHLNDFGLFRYVRSIRVGSQEWRNRFEDAVP